MEFPQKSAFPKKVIGHSVISGMTETWGFDRSFIDKTQSAVSYFHPQTWTQKSRFANLALLRLKAFSFAQGNQGMGVFQGKKICKLSHVTFNGILREKNLN